MIGRFASCPFPRRAGAPLVLAHRGASRDAPENTLAAFREALAQGADGVELDVMACGTGELVVCHDHWLDRLAGEHLEVRSTSLSRLQSLDVGSRFSARFAGERIPTLAEALALFPREAVVNVEIKSRGLRDRGLAGQVARELARIEGGPSIVLSSFDPTACLEARLRAHRVPCGVLVGASQRLWIRERLAGMLAASALHAHHRLCTPANVARWHARGLAVAAWTVDQPGEVARCCEAGIDAIITNRPAVTLAALPPRSTNTPAT